MKSINELHEGEGLSLSKQWDFRLIQAMQIAESGIDEDGDGFIRLRSGEWLSSVPAHEADRRFWHQNREILPANLCEDAMSVAWDAAQRFYRENGLGYVLPKSHYLYPGWLFLDIGAYIGFGTIKASRKIGEKGRILAVEGNEEAFRRLKKNVQANNLTNVYAVRAAVCDRDGPVQFHSSGSQQNSLIPQLVDGDSGQCLQFPQAQTVAGRTIDGLLTETGLWDHVGPAYASLEINGGEPAALRGMTGFIEKATRLDLRTAARYTPVGEKTSSREHIHQVLQSFADLHVRDNHPYVMAHKFPSEATS